MCMVECVTAFCVGNLDLWVPHTSILSFHISTSWHCDRRSCKPKRWVHVSFMSVCSLMSGSMLILLWSSHSWLIVTMDQACLTASKYLLSCLVGHACIDLPTGMQQEKTERRVAALTQLNIIPLLTNMIVMLNKAEAVNMIMPLFIESLEEGDASVPSLVRLRVGFLFLTKYWSRSELCSSGLSLLMLNLQAIL